MIHLGLFAKPPKPVLIRAIVFVIVSTSMRAANESYRANDILPPNLRMILSPTNYPSWVSPLLVSEANSQEQAIHNQYLRAVQAVRSNLLINSTEAEKVMALWGAPENVSALQQAGMRANDLQFAEAIEKFKQFHTAQALRQDKLAEKLSSKSNKRQRVNSNESSDTEMSQGDYVRGDLVRTIFVFGGSEGT